MRACRLLEHALTKEPKRVLDVGVGHGHHAMAFMSQGSFVTGLDVKPSPLDHPLYDHIEGAIELVKIEHKYDMIWCSHTLEHIPNVQMFLIKLQSLLKDDGWLYIAVPTDLQDRLHVGHLTLWTPAHLAYNLVCAGWDCKEALWYTEYLTIGMCVQKKEVIDLSWRTSMPSEQGHLNLYMPRGIKHNDGAWWGNNWPDPTDERASDPPNVTIGVEHTNLPPKTQLAYGPNPNLRKAPGTAARPKDGPPLEAA